MNTNVSQFLFSLRDPRNMCTWKQKCQQLRYRWEKHIDGGYIFLQQKKFDHYSPTSVDGLIADPETSEVICLPNDKVEVLNQATESQNPEALQFTYATDGTMLRLYFHPRAKKWYYATNSKWNANNSYWRGNKESFGALANQALNANALPDYFDPGFQYHFVLTHHELNSIIPSSKKVSPQINLHYILNKASGEHQHDFHVQSFAERANLSFTVTYNTINMSISQLKEEHVNTMDQLLSEDSKRGILVRVRDAEIKYLIETPVYTRARGFWLNGGIKDYCYVSQAVDRTYIRSLYQDQTYFDSVDAQWSNLAILYHSFYMKMYVMKSVQDDHDKMQRLSRELSAQKVDLHVLFYIHQCFLSQPVNAHRKRAGMTSAKVEQILRTNYIQNEL